MQLSSNTHLTAPSGRQGYSLVELLIGVFAGSMLILGMSSAVVIASKAVSAPTAQNALLDVAKASFILSDELQSSIQVLEQESDSIEFVVPDRNGDGSEEIIKYNLQSGSLIRNFNSETGVLLSDIDTLTISPDLRTVTETLPGTVTESTEAELDATDSANNIYSWSVDYYASTGQSLDITHPDNTALWSITEIDLGLRRSSSYQAGEVLNIQLREATGDGLPTSTILATASIPMSSLSTSFAWKTFSLSGAERLLSTQRVCVVVQADSSVWGDSGRVAYATSGFSGGGTMIATAYGYDWYFRGGRSLYYRIRGTRHIVDNSTHDVSRSYSTGYNVAVKHNSSTGFAERRVRLLNTPELLSGNWRLDFDQDPTDAVDVDFDGVEDWTAGSTALTGSSVGSQFTFADGESIESSVANDFADLISIDLKCKGESFNIAGGGASLQVPFGADSSTFGRLTMTAEVDSNGGQTATVVAADNSGGQTIALVKNLPDEIVEFRIVVEPSSNQVAVWINEVYQGRSSVQQPLSAGSKKLLLSADGASATFDFLSVRVGGTD